MWHAFARTLHYCQGSLDDAKDFVRLRAVLEEIERFPADAIRNEKVKVLGTVRPIALEDTVRGQYDGYRSRRGHRVIRL